MIRNQKYPKLDCHGFLERVFVWLRSSKDIEVFYAALELRFTFEKILIKHGYASTDYSDTFSNYHWQPKRLHNHLKTEFSSYLDIQKPYKFMLDPNVESSTMGYFLPVSQNLFDSYKNLNDYLHAQWAIHMFASNKNWYQEAYDFLFEFAYTLIPHASPMNSLDYLSIPNIQAKEIDITQLEEVLRDTLPAIQG